LVLPFWYQLTWVVPEKGPLNECDVLTCQKINAEIKQCNVTFISFQHLQCCANGLNRVAKIAKQQKEEAAILTAFNSNVSMLKVTTYLGTSNRDTIKNPNCLHNMP